MSIENEAGLEVVTGPSKEYVTIHLGNQLFGIPVLSVHDVHKTGTITPIPLAPSSVAGVLNLRGKIVTAIDLRLHLGFPPRDEDAKSMSVVIEHHGESYSLLIDEVGEVLAISDSKFERNPVTLDDRLREVSGGVYRLDGELMIIL
ncbi:MAG: chemotaxis protein CheW, partial [Sphingomonadales bacterium]|nr:chemotaxis protein CheW [Sphingomonadales bacterium]